jgi:hypothetical protein
VTRYAFGVTFFFNAASSSSTSRNQHHQVWHRTAKPIQPPHHEGIAARRLWRLLAAAPTPWGCTTTPM